MFWSFWSILYRKITLYHFQVDIRILVHYSTPNPSWPQGEVNGPEQPGKVSENSRTQSSPTLPTSSNVYPSVIWVFGNAIPQRDFHWWKSIGPLVRHGITHGYIVLSVKIYFTGVKFCSKQTLFVVNSLPGNYFCSFGNFLGPLEVWGMRLKQLVSCVDWMKLEIYWSEPIFIQYDIVQSTKRALLKILHKGDTE